MSEVTGILKSLAPENPEEQNALQSLLQTALSLVARAKGDLGWAVSGLRSPSDSVAIPKLLSELPEESRTQFFGLVEAMEIYHSIHGTFSALVNLKEDAVAELRKIREICLQGGTHAMY